MKKYLVLFCICSYASASLAQDYIKTQSLYVQGKVSRHGKNQLALRQDVLKDFKMFSLDSVIEFKAGGTIYKAFVVDGNRNHYQRIEQGRISLYRREKTFLLEGSTTITTFNKTNFRSVISSNFKCEGNDQSLLKLAWTKPSLKYIVRAKNRGDCNTDVIPHRKFGIVAGYNLTKARVSPDPGWSPSEKINVPTIGAFADLPFLGRKSLLYFTFEANYFAFAHTFFSSTATTSRFLGLEASGVNALGSLKFRAKRGKVIPYFKVGAMTSFLKLKTPTGYIETTKNGNDITLNGVPVDDYGNDTSLGVNLAGGIEVPLRKRMNLHFELRSTNSVYSSNDLDLRMSNVGLTAGISF